MEALNQFQAIMGDVKTASIWVWQNSGFLLTIAIADLILCFLGLLWLKSFVWKNKWYLMAVCGIVFIGYPALARIL